CNGFQCSTHLLLIVTVATSPLPNSNATIRRSIQVIHWFHHCTDSEVNPMQIQIISAEPEFLALEPEWNRLADAFGSPLLRFEVFVACRIWLDEPAKLAVFVARHDGIIHAIAPLIIDRSFGTSKLEPLAHRLHEPNAFLYADQPALKMMCSEILK